MSPTDDSADGNDGIEVTPTSELTEEQQRNRLDLIAHLGETTSLGGTPSDGQHPVVALTQQAEKARKKREKWEGKEVLACPACGTKTPKEDMESAIEAAERHDEKRHDGERTATVNGIVPPELSEEQKQTIQDTMDAIQEADVDETV